MAQNSEVSAMNQRRSPGRPVRKGVSRSPGGRPRAALDVQALGRPHTIKAIDTMVRALDNDKLCVSAAMHLLERRWGRPAAANDLGSLGEEDTTTFVLEIVGMPQASVNGVNGSARAIAIPRPANDNDDD